MLGLVILGLAAAVLGFAPTARDPCAEGFVPTCEQARAARLRHVRRHRPRPRGMQRHVHGTRTVARGRGPTAVRLLQQTVVKRDADQCERISTNFLASQGLRKFEPNQLPIEDSIAGPIPLLVGNTAALRTGMFQARTAATVCLIACPDRIYDEQTGFFGYPFCNARNLHEPRTHRRGAQAKC